jgi:hypothetical protein
LEKILWAVEKPTPLCPQKAPAPKQVDPKTNSSPKRNETAITITTLQAKSDGTLNSNRKYTTRKDHPRKDPGPV